MRISPRSSRYRLIRLDLATGCAKTMPPMDLPSVKLMVKATRACPMITISGALSTVSRRAYLVEARIKRGRMAPEKLVTAAELEQMPDHEDWELVRGRLVPVSPAGDRHGQAAIILGAELRAHVRKHGLGRVRVETGFVLFRGPDTVRGPDVSFVAAGRPAGDRSRDGFAEGAPDLAVEIISPTNTRREIAEKVAEYVAAGSRLVWVLDTDRRSAEVHRSSGTTNMLTEREAFDGEDVVPGFRYALADLFAELD